MKIKKRKKKPVQLVEYIPPQYPYCRKISNKYYRLYVNKENILDLIVDPKKGRVMVRQVGLMCELHIIPHASNVFILKLPNRIWE